MNAPVPAPRFSAVVARPHPLGAWMLSVIGKRTYQVVRERCVEAREQVPLVEEALFSLDHAMMLHDTDLLVNRTLTDVVVQGHTFAPSARATTWDAKVSVGDLERSIRAIGPRRVHRGADGRLHFTSPQAVEKVSLDWTSCFGGLDRAALEKHGDGVADLMKGSNVAVDPRFGPYGYARNPVGRGFVIEPSQEALEGCELPLLEEPLKLLTPETLALGEFTRWPAAPPPAALGWLSYNAFPRMSLMGFPPVPYDEAAYAPERFFEVQLGVTGPQSIRIDAPLPSRLDLRAAQAAAVGMRASRVLPGAAVELLHLHPRQPRWRFQLPVEPRVALRMPHEEMVSLQPTIRTLLLEPDLDRVTLVWVAEQRLSLPVGPRKQALIQHAFVWS